MKKLLLTSALCLAVTLPNAQAGTMGPMNTKPSFIPFASIEGAYSWNTLENNHSGATVSKDQWGGRLAAGLVHPWKDNLGLSLEVGYGYYGKTTESESMSNIGSGLISADFSSTISNKISGVDILAGMAYSYNQFDLFAKAGVMAETMMNKLSGSTNVNLLSEINASVNVINRSSNTAVLPEIKVGGNYNLNENIGISLAYMHVFGSSLNNGNTSVTVPSSSTAPVIVSINDQPTSLDAILFGLHYNFS